MRKDTPEAVYPDYPIHWENCPESVLGGLQRYVLKGIRTGGFLEAVLTNDLIATFSRADETNRECLGETIKFIYYELPSQCWGSPEKYTHWIQFGENSPYG